jgi:carbamoyltransferase
MTCHAISPGVFLSSSESIYVLGISAFYHDSAACLLRDGEIIAAAQEERFSRRKGDAEFPRRAAAYCLRAGGIGVRNLRAVGFYDKPLLKFERILETYLAVAPRGLGQFLKAGPLWIKEKLFTDRELRRAIGALRLNADAIMDGNTPSAPVQQTDADEAYEGDLFYAEHHESHAASAFFPSPFEEAAILTMDGVGEWATASMGVGRGSEIQLLKELRWPDSLGLLYSAFTYYTGFKVNSGEYKVMGLAPYGEPKYVERIYRELIDLREDGSFTINQKFFNYLSGLTMTSEAFHELFGGPPRQPETKLTQKEMDLARSVQVVCEEIMLRMARAAHRATGLANLCLAGGVALNCVGNGRILREGPFKRLWIQPAAGDAGGALGIAQLIWHRLLRQPRLIRSRTGRAVAAAQPELTRKAGSPGPQLEDEVSKGESRASELLSDAAAVALADRRDEVVEPSPNGGAAVADDLDSSWDDHIDAMQGAYLGPEFAPEEIAAYLESVGAVYHRVERTELIDRVASLLAQERVVGWFCGRMEFGPRALGARSILGDARSQRMQALMNIKIKFREGFRPFAPSVLRERLADYFELDGDSPYMLLVAPVRRERQMPMTDQHRALWGIDLLNVPRSDIPAVTHIDYSARIQTVDRRTSPEYYDLIKRFEDRTGCAVIVNTSFNVRGEPIVCTPEDAYRCFMRTHIDHLVLWPFLLDKAEQPSWKETGDWRTEFELD